MPDPDCRLVFVDPCVMRHDAWCAFLESSEERLVSCASAVQFITVLYHHWELIAHILCHSSLLGLPACACGSFSHWLFSFLFRSETEKCMWTIVCECKLSRHPSIFKWSWSTFSHLCASVLLPYIVTLKNMEVWSMKYDIERSTNKVRTIGA